jgi:hypothetical protein
MDGKNHTDVRTEEHENYATLEIRATRGDGTRDQERVKLAYSRDTLAEVEADREEALRMVDESLVEVRQMEYDRVDDGDTDTDE